MAALRVVFEVPESNNEFIIFLQLGQFLLLNGRPHNLVGQVNPVIQIPKDVDDLMVLDAIFLYGVSNNIVYSALVFVFECTLKYHVQLFSPLGSFLLPTHQVTVHQHYIGIIQLKPDYDCSFVACSSSQSSLYLRRLQVSHSAEHLRLDEQPNETAYHCFGNDKDILLLLITRHLVTDVLNGVGQQLFPLLHCRLVLPLEHIEHIQLHNFLQPHY